MPRGAPDHSNVTATNPLHRLDDMAELAARLRSPVTHDRSGNIIWIDSFEGGLNGWHKGTYGTGSTIVASPTWKRTGHFSAKLTGGSDGAGAAKIFRLFPYPILNKFGFETSTCFEAHTDNLLLRLARNDGDEEHHAAVRYRLADKTLEVLDADNVEYVFAEDVYLDYSYAPFHTFKLVVDFETDQYVRLILNEEIYDLSNYEPYVFTNATGPHVRTDILIYSETGYNGFSYIDDVIVTQGEP